MTTKSKKTISRWGILLAVSALALILGGAIYAQVGPGRGERHGGDEAPFMGPMGGQGGHGGPMEPGGPGGQMGPGGRGMMFMEDPEIRGIMEQIKLIEKFNEIELTVDQARSLLGYAGQVREIAGDRKDEIHEQIKNLLLDQRENVLEGGTFDPETMRETFRDIMPERDPGQMRDQVQPILDEAMAVFTEDQLEMLRRNAGPEADGMRDRFRQFQDSEQMRFFTEGMDPELRRGLEEHIQNRMGQMREGAACMMLGHLLMSPATSEALELYIEYND